MKEETVTQKESPFNYINRYPVILDSDDITFHLGKLALEKVNYEKLLDGLVKKNQEVVSINTKLEKLFVDLQNEVKELSTSNKSYVKNNEALDKALVVTRKLLEEKKSEIESFVSLNESLKDELKEKEKILKNMQEGGDLVSVSEPPSRPYPWTKETESGIKMEGYKDGEEW